MKSICTSLAATVAFAFLLHAGARADDAAAPAQDPALAIEQKLKTEFVSVDFTNATIEQVTEALAIKSRELDYGHRGVQFLIQPEAASVAGPVTLKLDNVPLGVALHYACELAFLRYKVDEHCVYIIPKYTTDGGDVVKRTFHVDPSFFEYLSSTGVIPAPQASP
jgi:hypothetical protein